MKFGETIEEVRCPPLKSIFCDSDHCKEKVAGRGMVVGWSTSPCQ